MKSEASGSVTHWLEGLKAGESVAAQELWNRYFARLVAVAEARLRNLTRESSGEDIALSAFKSVMLGVQADRYPDLADRTSLWPLLVTITARKSISELRRQFARKRDVTAVEQIPNIQTLVGDEPSPEFAIEVADELERLALRFDDPKLRIVMHRKLAGFTNSDIAAELSCSIRTVIRKLNLIRQEWEEGEAGEATTNDGHAS